MYNQKKNQLFRKYPDDLLIEKILSAFGFRGLNDRRCFSRTDLVKLSTVDKIKDIKKDLEKCYLPCKARTYLNDLNEKNVITILRQCLKTKNKTIFSREKYCKGDKFIIYNICNLDQKNFISVVNGSFEKSISSPIVLDFN